VYCYLHVKTSVWRFLEWEQQILIGYQTGYIYPLTCWSSIFFKEPVLVLGSQKFGSLMKTMVLWGFWNNWNRWFLKNSKNHSTLVNCVPSSDLLLYLGNLPAYMNYLEQDGSWAVPIFGWNFAKIWPEKYGFDLYKGFVMEKMTQLCPISKIIARFLW
jgi:hypothetical protein